MEMCISSAQVPYSFFNITQAYNNNKIDIQWPGNPILNITLPNGFYTVTDINQYLQNIFIQYGYYIIDSTGNNEYFFNMSYNPTYYAINLLFFLIPTSLPSGYTLPGTFAGFPAITQTLTFSVINNMKDYLGFANGIYPSNVFINNSIISSTPPIGSYINSIIIRSSLANNNITSPSDIVDSFAISDTSFGTNIDYIAPFPKWIAINNGNYNSFNITLYDQNLNDIDVLDNNILITILIRKRK